MKTNLPKKLRVNRQVILVLSSSEIELVKGGAGDGRVHCCSRYTVGTTESTASSSVLV